MPSYSSPKRSYDRHRITVFGSTRMLVSISEDALVDPDEDIVVSPTLQGSTGSSGTNSLLSRSSWGNQSFRTGLADLANHTVVHGVALLPTLLSSLRRDSSSGGSNNGAPSSQLSLSSGKASGYFVDES
jgi:hypothetical protein